MGISIQRRRGTTVQHSTFTGKVGEVTVDTTKWVAVIHNGSTAGGFPLSLESHTHANATTSVPGFMSATDKTKLDGISGSTISYQIVQAAGTPQTARNALNLTANFTLTDDGAGNRTSVDLSDSGVGAGTYTKLTVNTKGRVTAATVLAAGDIPNITSAKVTDFDTQVRTSRLDQMAVPTSDLNANTHKIINVSDPTAATDAANKNYVDTIAVGLYFKAACRAASTANVNLSAPGSSIDTVSLSSGDRVLLKDQSTATQNGIYTFNGASSTMTRTLDANEDAEVKPGMFVFISAEGSANGDTAWVLATTGAISLGSTNLTFVQFSGSTSVVAGNGITLTGSTVSVHTVSASRIAVGAGGVDLATTAVTPAAGYNTFTVDTYGRVTAASTVSNQPLHANLTSLATLVATGFVVETVSGTFTNRTLQPGTGIAITNGDGVAGNVSIGVTDDASTQRVRVAKNGSFVAARREINLIEGSGCTLTTADNSGSNRMDVTIAVTPGAGAAPATSQYVTLATDVNLSNERVLAVGAGITLTDGGANGNVTLAFTTDLGSVP